ncbi:hypothetical protein [uncultured Clostridium sp.]|jgi:hypothetical protein|uniref:hypothetical protein n=1 Tax=uncultured Clostridium sp. TaxID=59620 RepID=UPI00262FD8D2|nr:hypothetical protein [uncultured Clostridium sp.]
MKLKFIMAVSLVVVLSVSYYIGNSISKETPKTTQRVSSIKKSNDNNFNTNIKKTIYTKAQKQELLGAQKLINIGKYPLQKSVRVVTSLKYDNGIMIPKGTYEYMVDGGEIGLARTPFAMYAISNKVEIKSGIVNPLQTKPSKYNIENIFSNAKKLNVIGAINGYYYVSYSELGSSNISYAFIMPSKINLLGNVKPRQLSYVSNLKLYKLSNTEDYKISGFNIYKTPYMLGNVERTLNYNELMNFTPVIIAGIGDMVEIFYNNQIGWIHSDRLISI